MKASELRPATSAELANKLDDAYQELFNLRFQRATGKLGNTSRFRQVKRDIARIKTILHEHPSWLANKEIEMREQRRALVGKVTSDKMDMTVVVAVERTTRHRLYGKVIKVNKKYKAHDAGNAVRTGDVVRIRECRPISKDKKFFVEAILQRAEHVDEANV